MGGLFSKPKTPKVEMPPPVPVVDDQARARAEQDAYSRRRKARRSTVIAGGQAGPVSTGKTVLGG